MNRIAAPAAVAVLAAVALAGCGTGSGSGTGGYGSPPSASAPAMGKPSTFDLSVATTTLGKIVVDGKGMTAYVYNKDVANSGTSACTGGCASIWPAIIAASATPSVSGVTGTVGEIASTKQVTINGLPLHTYTGDSKAGDTTGQGFGGIWWVVSPAGTKISGGASGGGGY